MDDHSSGTAVANDPLAANPGLSDSSVPVALPRHKAPIWHCSRWGLPCRGCYQPRGGPLPHRFTIPTPRRRCLFSVALSLGLPPPGVTRHRALWSPDFPRPKGPRPSSHPRKCGVKLLWRLRQRGSVRRDQQSSHNQSRLFRLLRRGESVA